MILSLMTVTIPFFFKKAAYWNWGEKLSRYKTKKIRREYFAWIIMVSIVLKTWEDGLFESIVKNIQSSVVWNWIYDKILIFRQPVIEKYIMEYQWLIWVIFLFALHVIYHIIKLKNIGKERWPDKIWNNIINKLKITEDTLPYAEITTRISEKWEAYERYGEINGDGNREIYILKDNYVQIRTLYKCMFVLSIIVVFGVAGWFKIEPEVCEASIPIAEGFRLLALLVALATYFMEQYSYYNGFTKEEYLTSIENSNIQDAAKDVEDIGFGDSLKLVRPGGPKNVLFDEKQDRIERINRIYGSSENRMHCLGIALKEVIDDLCSDNDFIDAAVRLVKHQSVYFAIPFYQDLGNYIFPFLSMELLENKKILVISGIKNRDEELKQWFSKGLQKKYGYLEFWDVQNMQDEIGGADIGLISLGHINKIIDNADVGFWENVSVVVLLEPSLFLPYHPIIMSQILMKIKGRDEKITYIVCDVNTGGMIDFLSDMLKEEFVYVNATKKGADTVGVLVDADHVNRGNPFVRVNQCFANELYIAAFLRKYFKEKIHWYGNYAVPIIDIAWQAGQYYNQITDETEDIANMGIINEIFDYKEDGNEAVYEPTAINIVEDSIYNAFEMLRQYSTRGAKKAFTAVFSANYMLHDFMKDKKYIQILDNDVGYISQHMPRFQRSKRNLAIDIAYHLTMGSIEICEFKKILFYYGYVVESSIEKILCELNQFYEEGLGIASLSLRQVYEKKEEENLAYGRILVISEEGRNNFLDWYNENIAVVRYYSETTKNKSKYLDAVAGGHIYQFYLPGQYIIVEGKYYKIEKIEKEDAGYCLILQKASDDYTYRRYYRQFRRYCLKETGKTKEVKLNREYLKVDMLEADIEVCTDGYICGKQFNEIFNGDIMNLNNIPKRKYRKKYVLRIKIKFRNIYTYALLLKELLFTYFPHCWQLLSVAMVNPKELKGYIDKLEVESDLNNIDENEIYIMEDSPMDLGLLETISNKFDDLLGLMADYAEWGSGRGAEQMRNFWGSIYLFHPELLDLNSITTEKKLLFNVYRD